MKLALLALAFLLAGCSFAGRIGTKGTMPPPGPDGGVDPSSMPDFVGLAGETGQVGWVEKAAIMDPSDKTWPVYADDLRTVVGHLVPGRGFVPVGVDANAAPTLDVQVGAASPGAPLGGGNVTVYVRNCGPVMAWIAAVRNGRVDGFGAAGYWPNGYIGAGDFNVGNADQVALIDRSPSEAGASPRQLIYAGGPAAQAMARWVSIDKTGVTAVGDGEPAWWQGAKPPC